MTTALLFWLLMAFALVFGPADAKGATRSWASFWRGLFPWLALAVIGWHVFGWPIQG